MSPVQPWEIFLAFVDALTAIVAWTTAHKVWEARNGGSLTKWVVFVLITYGLSHFWFGAVNVLFIAWLGIDIPNLTRWTFWPCQIAEMIAVLSFALIVIPKAKKVLNG
jgi:hypothetical protein